MKNVGVRAAKKAHFPRLEQIRTKLRISLKELSDGIGPYPSLDTIRRLERGTPIGILLVKAVFNFLNEKSNGTLVLEEEVIPV